MSEKIALITKSDSVNVTNPYSQTPYYVVDICSNLLKDFHGDCHFNMFDQIVVGIDFTCFRLKNYKKHSFALQHDQYAEFLRRRVTQITKKKQFECTATESA